MLIWKCAYLSLGRMHLVERLRRLFDVVISNCKTNSFDNNYIKLTGNYTINDGFLDNPGKTFAVRISANDNANQSSADFITETNNVFMVEY